MSIDPLSPERIASLVADLVRIPSVNPTIAPSEGGSEGAIATFARDWLLARGVEAWTEEVLPGRPNVVAEVGDGSGPILVLCAHLDTVGTAGMTGPFEPRIEGDRLFGRGSYDMKGGVAAVMAVAAALAGRRIGGRLMLALVVDEEHASLGTSAFLARHHAHACIVTEPSALELVLAHKGFVWADITTTGRAAHGSRWDIGQSAIATMGRVITALDEYDREVLRLRRHALVGPASMHAALVDGGTGLSTYAASCRLQVERRTLPGETAESVVSELRSVIAAVAPDAIVEPLLDRPPLDCDAGSHLAGIVRDAATGVLGVAPRETGVGYWMDAALFEGAGIPTVNFGGDGAGAHEEIEWVSLSSIVKVARVLERASLAYLSSLSV